MKLHLPRFFLSLFLFFTQYCVILLHYRKKSHDGLQLIIIQTVDTLVPLVEKNIYVEKNTQIYILFFQTFALFLHEVTERTEDLCLSEPKYSQRHVSIDLNPKAYLTHGSLSSKIERNIYGSCFPPVCYLLTSSYMLFCNFL